MLFKCKTVKLAHTLYELHAVGLAVKGKNQKFPSAEG